MKLLLFVLGLAVASATIQLSPEPQDIHVPHSYKDVGKSFIYRYEAFLNTTLPQSGLEFVGQKIKCDVELNILTSEIIHMNLTNILVQEVNGTYNATLRERNILYPVNISVWNSSLTQNYTRELKNPITFQYINGKILKVFANESDPEWVVNLKKGIINMLTLQLENDDIFTKKEEGISGTCHTVYLVEESRNKDNVKVFNITKTRNLNNCTDSPTFRFKTPDLKECKECDKEVTQQIKAIATFKYNVTGERNEFFIESCKSDASYVLVPQIDFDKGSYAVFQNQSLVLKEVKSKEIHQLEDLKERGSIKFIFPEIVDDIDRFNSTLKKVEFFTNVLSNHTFTNFTLETPSHFINLVRSLRECNITQMRQVWNFTEKTMYKRDWIIKALPYVNKTDMTLLVKEMFFNRTINITHWHGEELLLGLGGVQKPTVKMIQNIRDVCEMDIFREPITDVPRENITRILRTRRACFVGLGNMMRRFNKDEKFVPSTLVRSLTDCEETWRNPLMNPSIINMETYEMLMEFRNTDVKLHCIEAMGNAGLPDHVDLMKEIIEQKTDEVVPIEVRLAAITSLRYVAKELPRKVMSILLPVLKNPTEDNEVRITSYLTALECEPTPAMLTLITEELNKWTNPEVRTFVYSHLKNLAKSTNPLEKRLAMAARYAILFVKPLNVTLKQSQNRRMEFFTEDKKKGIKCELDTVFGTQNIIPRKVNTKCDVAINGNFLNLMELNVHTESLNDVLDRIFGQHGSWHKRKSIFDMLKEKKTRDRVDNTKLELSNIKNKVNPYTKQTYRHASTQFKMFENEVWFTKFDDQFFNELMDEGKLSTKMIDIEMELMKPQRFNFTKAMMIENHEQFPTVMGLPLSLNTTVSSLMRVMVNTTFVAQPSLQDAMHTDLVAKVNVTPEVLFINTRTFGCHTPFNKLFSETNNTANFTLPLATKLIVDYDLKKYSVEIDHLKRDRVDVLNLKHNVSLIHEKTMCGKSQIFKKNITVINGTQTGTPFNSTWCFQPYDDSAKLCLNVTSFKSKKPSEPSLLFRGPMLLEVFAKKGTYTPDKVILEYEPTNLPRWSQGVKTSFIKLRFAADKSRTNFEERYITADIELEDRKPLRDTDDIYSFVMTMKRNDIPEWRAKIKGFQRGTENIEVDCQWGQPKEQVIVVNGTDKNIQREYFVRFVSDRWLLPTQTVHNLTLLWADTPEWLKTVGQTYKDWAPMVKFLMVKTFTPWDIMMEPKRNWLDNSYAICMKTKSNNTMDLIFVMPDQEITITNLTSPVHTEILKKPLPVIVKSIIKPNITLIPLPKTCKINSTGIQTFDKIHVNYTLPSSCPHILVKDCSTDERFTVLVQNVTLREERDTVKSGLKSIVYVSKRKFELLTRLDTDQTTKILEVKVDGEKFLENWRSENEVEIENTNTTLRRNETHISLISGQGLKVVLSTKDLQVNVSQRHWNTTCGLCGNNDEVKESEFRTPWTTLPTHVKNDTKFGVSWLVPGDDCNDPECKLTKFESFPLNRIENEEVFIGDNNAACFSNEPVFYCPRDCTPVPMEEVFLSSDYIPKKKTVQIGFSCIRTDDPITEYEKYKDMRFNTKVADLIREVEVPQRCDCLPSCQW